MIKEDNQIKQRTFDSVAPASKDNNTIQEKRTKADNQRNKKKINSRGIKKIKGAVAIVFVLFIVCCLTFLLFLYIQKKNKEDYIENAIAEAEQKGNDDYEYSIMIYENALKIHNYEELETKLNETKEEYRSYLESEAIKYKSQKKYGDAIKNYRTLITFFDDNSYNSEIEYLMNDYAEPVISEVESLLEVGDTNNAREKLDEATEEIGYCKQIEDEKNKVDALEVNMLDSFSISKDGDFDNCEFEENNYCISFRFFHLTTDNYVEATYFLGGKYEAMNTSINIDGMSDEIKDNSDGIVLSIYGDGDLIYVSEPLNYTNDSIDAIDIHLNNLSVYEKIVFVARGNNTNLDADYYDDNGIYLIVRQPTLVKEYNGGIDIEQNEDGFIPSDDCFIDNIAINYDEEDYSENIDSLDTFKTRYYHFSLYCKDDSGVPLSYVVERVGEEEERQYFESLFYNGDSGCIWIEWECPEEYMVYGNSFPERIRIYRDDTGEQIGVLESSLYR